MLVLQNAMQENEHNLQLDAKINLKEDSIYYFKTFRLIVLGFNDTSTLVGLFVSSPREREKRDSTGDEREGQGRKRNRKKSEETEEIKCSSSTITCYKDSRPSPTGSQYQLDAP